MVCRFDDKHFTHPSPSPCAGSACQHPSTKPKDSKPSVKSTLYSCTLVVQPRSHLIASSTEFLLTPLNKTACGCLLSHMLPTVTP